MKKDKTIVTIVVSVILVVIMLITTFFNIAKLSMNIHSNKDAKVTENQVEYSDNENEVEVEEE